MHMDRIHLVRSQARPTAVLFATFAAMATVLTTAAVLGPAPSAGASPAGVAACSGNVVDVNGDGFRDLVGGDPGATVGAAASAGDIVVRYGTSAGPGLGSQTTLTQADAGLTPAAGDGFGSTVLMGFVDGDTCADVVVATPGDTVGSGAGAGSVQVIFGSAAGLGLGRPALTLDAATPGLGSGAVAGEHFGSALALADDQAGGEPIHLAIGNPGRDLGSAVDAGAVGLIDLATDGSVALARTLTQSSAGVVGTSETGDRFGAALAFGYAGDACAHNWCEELVVGVPGENDKAGALVAIDGTATAGSYTSTAWSQNTPGVAGTAEAGDGFGSSLATHVSSQSGGRFLAVGVPGEDVGSITDAGAVQLFRYGATFSPSDNQLISQDTPGMGGAAERYDRFGTSVMLTEYWSQSFHDGLVVGTPSEDLGSVPDAGTIALIDADGRAGDDNVTLTQDSPGVPGVAQASEHFGQSLAATGDFGDLLIGVPDDVGYSRGVLLAMPWTTVTGIDSATGTAWQPATGTRFGASIAGPLAHF